MQSFGFHLKTLNELQLYKKETILYRIQSYFAFSHCAHFKHILKELKTKARK